MSVTVPEIDFESQDGFLHGVLGLISASLQIGSLAPSDPDIAPPAAGEDDAVLHALLGVVALGRCVESVAASWARESPGDEPAPGNAAVRRVEDILR